VGGVCLGGCCGGGNRPRSFAGKREGRNVLKEDTEQAKKNAITGRPDLRTLDLV